MMESFRLFPDEEISLCVRTPLPLDGLTHLILGKASQSPARVVSALRPLGTDNCPVHLAAHVSADGAVVSPWSSEAPRGLTAPIPCGQPLPRGREQGVARQHRSALVLAAVDPRAQEDEGRFVTLPHVKQWPLAMPA